MKKLFKWGCLSFLGFIILIIIGTALVDTFYEPTIITKEETEVENTNQPKTKKKVDKPKENKADKKPATLPQNPKIELRVAFADNKLNYSIKTDIPLPVEVMIGISPKGIAEDDPAYGFSQRVRIDKSPFTISLKAENTYDLSPTPLKNGTYEATVGFYPNWGAKNGNLLSGKIKNNIQAKSIIEIRTSKNSGSIESELEKSKKQSWGMNVKMKDKWNERKFVKNLGKYEELETKGRDPKIVKTYYFPEADMTFFISKPLKQVLMWKIGKDNNL